MQYKTVDDTQLTNDEIAYARFLHVFAFFSLSKSKDKVTKRLQTTIDQATQVDDGESPDSPEDDTQSYIFNCEACGEQTLYSEKPNYDSDAVGALSLCLTDKCLKQYIFNLRQ